MSHATSAASLKFSELNVAPKLLAILDRLKFTVPTPIQQHAIPLAVAGKDIIGIAQTGTGKTLAFVVPLLQKIARTKEQGMIILPTRELAMQVAELLQQMGQQVGLKQALLIGGASMPKQIQELRQRPHVIVGTPGRMIDHLEQGRLSLQGIGVVVLDEADRMLDMGFAPQIKRILDRLPTARQTLLFSATMPPEIVAIAAKYMKNPERVEVARAGTVASGIRQEVFVIPKEHKGRLLDKLLHEYTGTVLVFSRTKHGAKRICRAITAMDHAAAEIHSNLSLSQRKRSLAGFKSGKYRVLVATDIAARGIDVTNIELVINYDLPDNPDDYIHRIGRTGRAGQSGQAISFITPDQRGKIRHLERLVRTPLQISVTPELPAARAGSARPSERTEEVRFSSSHRRVTFRHPHRTPQKRSGQPHRGNRRAQRRARVHL